MKKLNFEQMENTVGGWRLFGEQTDCDEANAYGNCTCTIRTFFLGIRVYQQFDSQSGDICGTSWKG